MERLNQNARNLLAKKIHRLSKSFAVSARVMLTKNNPKNRQLVNGTMGSIVAIDYTEKNIASRIVVQFDGEAFPVPTEIYREIFYHYTYQGNGFIIKQFPLEMAFATTIHKNQSLTIETGMVNLNNLFTPGQGYVAFSRIKTLKGLYIIDMNESSFKANQIGIEEYIRLKKKSGNPTDELEGYLNTKVKKEGNSNTRKSYAPKNMVLTV
jgi:ATP-dependent exoDNAse (exonuclease V) alpha subunit